MYSESLSNKKRIVDQMASMHFRLSDCYKRWLSICNIIEIIVSVALCSITFVNMTDLFGIDEFPFSLVVGLASVFLFMFTLIKQHFELGKNAEKHYNAGKVCASLKNTLSTAIDREKGEQYSCEDITKVLDDVQNELNRLVQIPDKKFAKLKHYHLRKVLFSKYLDKHANRPWIVCRICFFFFPDK